jgi:hypothetical protein
VIGCFKEAGSAWEGPWKRVLLFDADRSHRLIQMYMKTLHVASNLILFNND